MRFAFLIALAGGALLRADIVTFTTTAQTDSQFCGDFQSCQPFGLGLPQFDPARGNLQSITWTFTDVIQYYGGYNDMYETPGQSFTWTTTEGDQNALLGLDASNTQLNSSVTTGTRQISMGGWWRDTTLAASGVVPMADESAFLGNGGLAVMVTPFQSASFPVVDGSDNGGVFAALIEIQNSATLTVTATYAPVPEPRYSILVLCLAGAILIHRWQLATPGPPSPT